MARSLLFLAAALLACLTSAVLADSLDQGPEAAIEQRRLVVVNGADYFGHDYDTLEGVGLDDCEAACLADSRCRAFTFNRNAGWCFLKSDYGQLRAFDGAVSGRIVTGAPDERDRTALRRSELAFLPTGYRDEAAQLRSRITRGEQGAESGAGVEGTFDQLLADAQSALRGNDARRAVARLETALRLAPDDHPLWLRLAEAAMAVDTSDWALRQRFRQQATGAAINSYLTASDAGEQARALALIGRSLEARSAWRPAIRAERASLALVQDAALQAHLDSLIAEHGFRVVDHSVSSDARDPRICIQFSDPLARDQTNLADFVQLDAQGVAIEAEARQICMDGVIHGERYHIRLRAGLPANDGERLSKTVALDVYVRDRSPAVRFPGRAYVLPSGGAAALPVVTVNTGLLDATLYRIPERALGGYVADDKLFAQLNDYEAEAIAERRGERLWQGQIEVRSELNREVTTAVPIGGLLGKGETETGADPSASLQPGVYILTAVPADALDSDELATQWFVVSDLGLTALSSDDGLHAFVRSLSTAEPLAAVRLRLMALNEQVLGEATTDAQGYARFESGLLLGDGGNAPALLVAEGPGDDYGFLDMQASPFDLGDRGVGGRPAPKPIDCYLVSERGIYRPGEPIVLTALTRDPRAAAVTGVPLTFVIRRPDGVEFLREQVPDQGLGGHLLRVSMLPDAMRGTWQAQVLADPDGEVLAQTGFLVEDFEPERLDVSLAPSSETIDPQEPPSIAVDARFLYGAPAANLDVEGSVRVTPADGLEQWPGWRLGLSSELHEDRSAPLPGAQTDAAGRARLGVALPELSPSTRPRQAEITVQVLDGGGRPVERTLSLPVLDPRPRIALKPLFTDAVGQGGNAQFDVMMLGSDGQPIDASGLTWTLSKVQTSYQWYRTDGDWRFEPVVSRSRVASGSLDAPVGTGRPARIEAQVDWGGYELEVHGGSLAVPASVDFEAGWYVAPKAFDTPDALKVSLDKPEYRIGERAQVRLEPRFAGLALVMVLSSEGLVAMRPAEVPEAGTTVELPVTEEWGPGAYVTAVLYRGMDLAARRMPRRAIGLHWTGVDPEHRRLALELDVPSRAAPRGALDIGVTLGNLPPDDDAFVTVAAVDVGILNLTRFEDWSPGKWYFGQRRLGAAIRDLYGQLIDRMQGESGRLRSGSGARMLMSFEGPPPSEALVAFQSAVLPVDSAGRAETSFELPDFNGRVRVMAMAWSAQGVGQASEDVLVRDPIVATAAMPRFLAPGDRSRILLELTHVEGPAGHMEVSLTSNGNGLRIEHDGTPLMMEIPERGRVQASFGVEATAPGDNELLITLVTPAGDVLTKTLRLGVRSLEPPVHRTTSTRLLPAGNGAGAASGATTLTLDAAALSDAGGGFLPGTGAWLVSISGAGSIDVPGLLWRLERYPYGCVEQVTSRALPLLYLDEVALASGLPAATDLRKRVDRAIAQLLSSQSPAGGFGLWGPGDSELWLDAYVTDFLTRAGERGHSVSSAAFDNALDNLRNRLGYAADFSNGGEGIAYSLYVLARNGRVPVGDLRYYLETKLDAFATPMARAQIGAALALYGEHERAASAMRSALALWQQQNTDAGWRDDFGSRLRDGAALLSLGAEAGGDLIDLDALAAQLEQESAATDYTSTQEQAWMLMAAHALMEGAARPRLLVDGEAYQGALYRHLDEVDLAVNPLSVVNAGDRSVMAVVMATGVPLTPPPASGNGYRIERAYYDLDGRRIDPAQVDQGDKYVVIVTVNADRRRAARLLIDDPLPAGFEIDNPHLLRSGSVEGLPWLNTVEEPSHVAFGAERFVAAVDREERDPTQFQLAYVVRAVSPGDFVHPAATVEAMYQPALRARTASGRVEVKPPAPSPEVEDGLGADRR